jgi:hypothetical protein
VKLKRIEAGCYDTLDDHYRIERGTDGVWVVKECIRPHRTWSCGSLAGARQLLADILQEPS